MSLSKISLTPLFDSFCSMCTASLKLFLVQRQKLFLEEIQFLSVFPGAQAVTIQMCMLCFPKCFFFFLSFFSILGLVPLVSLTSCKGTNLLFLWPPLSSLFATFGSRRRELNYRSASSFTRHYPQHLATSTPIFAEAIHRDGWVCMRVSAREECMLLYLCFSGSPDTILSLSALL